MKKFKVTIKGEAPFLMARHPTPAELEIILAREGEKGVTVKGLTPEEQFEMHAYRNGKGLFVLPSNMIEAAMTKAAVNFKLVGAGKKTMKDVIKGGINIEEFLLVFKNQVAESDGQWGVNPTTRGAVWIVRPRIDVWEVSFTLSLIQDTRVEPKLLEEILAYSGDYVGVGSWRPKFGRFKVVSFEEIKIEKEGFRVGVQTAMRTPM